MKTIKWTTGWLCRDEQRGQCYVQFISMKKPFMGNCGQYEGRWQARFNDWYMWEDRAFRAKYSINFRLPAPGECLEIDIEL